MEDGRERPAIVELSGIRKQFPGVLANDDISLAIREGEIFAVLGENGAGKTTLMNILFGLYRPDQGEIRIRGQKVEFNSPRDAAALGIGMVHQHFKLVENYTVAENIILGLEPVKKALGLFPLIRRKDANREIAQLSDQYGLSVNPRMRIKEASVSDQQRVEILKMLYRKADILIFDEPTAMLAPQEIEHLIGVIHELRRDGKTIILITHKLDEIKRLADRCAVLRRGRLIDVFEVATTDTAHMATTMVGHEVDDQLEREDKPFGDAILTVESLSVKQAKGVMAVKDVSFSVRSGEVLALAGVSGNGQIEIVEAIYGQIKASSGAIYLNGRDITNHSIRQRIRQGISYVPEDRQKTGLVVDMTLAENLALKTYGRPPFSRRHVLNREAFSRHAQGLIQAYDIRSGSGESTVVHAMSGGNQQKAIVAREIDLDNQVIIFVQPTRGLDIAARAHIHRQIMNERAKGHAILLVSLELDEIMELADTIGVLYNGQIKKIAAAGLMTIEEVGRLMLGGGGMKDRNKDKRLTAKTLMAKYRSSRLLIPLVSVLFTFLVLILVFVLIGRNPFTAIYSFFQGSGLGLKPSYTKSSNMLTDFLSYLGILSPMLLGALAVVVGLRGGLFNIGVSGQMLLSGFLATILVGYSKLPPALAIPLVLLIGLFAGAFLGSVIGWLKYRFNVHEVVSSIMFNYIVSFLTGYFIKTKYVDPIIRSSRQVLPNAKLQITFQTAGGLKLIIPVGIFIAIAMAFLIRFYLERMTGGFEIRMVGFNRQGAAYAGLPIQRVMVRTMLISGALAGLAGVTYYLGYYSTIVPKDLPSLGFDAIAVALLGNLGPVACILSSALITIFQKGAVYMSSSTGVVREIASLVTGILLLFSSLGVSMRDRTQHFD